MQEIPRPTNCQCHGINNKIKHNSFCIHIVGVVSIKKTSSLSQQPVIRMNSKNIKPENCEKCANNI